MKITLYKNMGGSKLQVTKSPSDYKTIEAQIRPTIGEEQPNINLKNPVLLVDLSFDEIGDYVYARIFNKYYFIEDYKIYNDDLMEIICNLDVLKTYSSEILNTDVILSYESDYYNPYIADPRVLISSKNSFYKRGVGVSKNAIYKYVVGVNGASNLTNQDDELSGVSYYALTLSEANELIENLYTTTFTESLNQTLFNKTTEGLISLSYIPFGIDLSTTEWSYSNITIGNVALTQQAIKLQSPTEWKSDVFNIQPNFNNFIDYNHTTIELIIAGLGGVQLDPKEVIGKNLRVHYKGRPYLGDCLAEIKDADGFTILTTPVSLAINLPLNIESNVEPLLAIGSKLITPIASSAGAALGGGVAGAFIGQSLASGISEIKQTSNTTSGSNSQIDSFSHDLYIKVSYPDSYISNENYTNVLNVSGRSGKLSTFFGYLVCSTVNPANLTNPYSDEIISLLKSGIII